MQKLSLKLDDLALQSFETTPGTLAAAGTVAGHLSEASYDGLGCSDACASRVYTCAGCETYDEPCTDDGGSDAGRRIIVYQSPG